MILFRIFRILWPKCGPTFPHTLHFFLHLYDFRLRLLSLIYIYPTQIASGYTREAGIINENQIYFEILLYFHTTCSGNLYRKATGLMKTCTGRYECWEAAQTEKRAGPKVPAALEGKVEVGRGRRRRWLQRKNGWMD